MNSTDPFFELLAKYKKALGHAKMGLWEIDFLTDTVTWDEGVRQLYEAERKVYSCSIIESFINLDPEDNKRITAEIEMVRLDLAELDSLFRVNLSNGIKKFIRTNGIKIRDENNKVIGLVGMNWDVTQEYKLQEALNKSKEFLEMILDAIPDPIFIKDEQHRTIFANKEFEKISGFKKKDLIGRLDSDFVSTEASRAYWKQDESVLKSDYSFEYEEVIKDQSGNDRQLLTKKMSLQMSEKEKVLVGVIRDITEIKKIQNSLVEQSKLASLGEIAAGIAHEINNPLMIIQAKSQILQDKLNQNPNSVHITKLIQDLRSIENNSIRIDKIIKSLKAITRDSSHDPFEDISLKTIIEEAIEISKERLSKDQVQLTFFFDKTIHDNYNVKARGSELIQVLINLLNNSFDAIKNLEKPWIHINLLLHKTDFIIEVMDSGLPIKAEVAKRMMEPFFTTKTASMGTGLGLSVSQQIIHNHHGKIFYDPKSKNTKFVVQLKRSEYANN